MNKLLYIIAITMICMVAFAEFPTNTTVITSEITEMSRDFSDFKIKWVQWEDQIVTFTVNNNDVGFDLTGFYCKFRAARHIDTGQTNDLDIGINDITINVSNATFSVAKTNLPGIGVYQAELLLLETSTTNIVRPLGRGKLNVLEGLFP